MSRSVRHFNTYSILICIALFSTLFIGQLQGVQPTHRQTNSIHEADEQDLKVLGHIADLQKEICTQINLAKSRSRIQMLKKLYNELAEIARDYTELSPGTAFLGPFSSVSLVLKQRELQKRIAEIEKQVFG